MKATMILPATKDWRIPEILKDIIDSIPKKFNSGIGSRSGYVEVSINIKRVKKGESQ